MNAFTERRLGWFGVVLLPATAVLVTNVAAAVASTSTTQLQRAPFVAARSLPAATPGDGGESAAVGPVVAATNQLLARAPFVAVPIPAAPAFGSGVAAVPGASTLARLDGTSRVAFSAPAPGPLVLNTAPTPAATGLAILGGIAAGDGPHLGWDDRADIVWPLPPPGGIRVRRRGLDLRPESARRSGGRDR